MSSQKVEKDPCYEMAKNLAKPLPMVRQKTENVENELLLLTKVISKQNVQSVNWFLLYVKQKGQMEMS